MLRFLKRGCSGDLLWRQAGYCRKMENARGNAARKTTLLITVICGELQARRV